MTNYEKTPQTTGLIFGENIGAFGIGAATALLEQNISVSIIVAYGTGVLDAMLFAGRDIPAMRTAWENTDIFNAIFAKTAQLANRFVSDWGGMSSTVREAATEAALNEPDALKIKADLRQIFDEEAIRSSDVNIVIMTCPENESKAKLIPVSDIPKGKLIDYILRAVTLPTLISDRQGRYHRRYPEEIGLHYLSEAGMANVITVGLPEALPCPRYMHRVIIESSEYLDVTFENTKENIVREITLGRLDAMKALGLLEGHDYYIDPVGAHTVFDALVDALDKHPVPLTDNVDDKADVMPNMLKLLRQTAYSLAPNSMLSLLEIVAKQSGVKRLIVYSPDGFIAAILDALERAIRQYHVFLSPGNDLLKTYFHPDESDKHIPKFCLAYVLFIREKNNLSANDKAAVLREMTAEERLALFMVINIHHLF